MRGQQVFHKKVGRITRSYPFTRAERGEKKGAQT